MIYRTGKAYRVSLLFMLPAILLFAVFFLYPAVRGFGYSFTDWDGLNAQPRFVGLDNFAAFLRDPDAVTALGRTLSFAFLIVTIQNVVALALAVLLDGKRKGAAFFKSTYFIPSILSTVVVGYLWAFMYDPINGVLTTLFSFIGLQKLAAISWLGSKTYAFYAVVIAVVWQYFGYSMVIYISGLQTIPEDLYEAADIDGTNAWQKFYSIKVPLLAPVFTINLVLSVIGALKLFDHIFVLTQGGPGGATETLTVLMYDQAFGLNRMGYGSAIAFVLCAFVFALSFIQLKFMQRKELEG